MADDADEYDCDSNVVDFIEIKLLSMADEYANKGRLDMAEAVWNALDAYMTGSVNIVFKNGMPYMSPAIADTEYADENNE